MIVPAEQTKPPYWRRDVANGELWCSSYHISETSIGGYLRALEDFEPNIIYAYPSSLFAIVQYATKQQREISLPHLRGIVTSSETLSSWQRESIEEYFKVRVFDWYGLFERVIFIGTCEYGRYHVFPDYGYTEFVPLREGGRGDEYELIGTSFINSVVPLIRYRTGDIVRIEGDPSDQCECGRVFPCVNSILGRLDDVIVTPTGRVIGRLDFIFKTATNITFGQIIQESENELRIVVVPGEHYSDGDRAKLCTNARRLVGETMRISVETVDHIPHESNGKFRGVISKVSRGHIEA
jgi:phenylacetate-CoA ligase